ncbi:hypothetical protein F5144DRAFT_611523 [Chaetomium tenue]|uniref:Uncharacterized protein n=1 Tax=Chaetomium tenue TaxID=1854479 RepID=A0ACB7PEV3_9PEZI|nr:hypothetical protein F5144DRAFT_611523 [Chaetomium globosum]
MYEYTNVYNVQQTEHLAYLTEDVRRRSGRWRFRRTVWERTSASCEKPFDKRGRDVEGDNHALCERWAQRRSLGRSDRDPRWDSRDATWSKQRPTRRPSVGVQDKKEFAA